MSKGQDDRAKLALLADAFMQDILQASDEDILAEADQDRLVRVRTIIIEVKANLAKRTLSKAKAEHEAWTAARPAGVVPFDRKSARIEFEKIGHGDPEFNRKMLLAARNGKAPTDTDVEGLADDWADLQRLYGKDSSE